MKEIKKNKKIKYDLSIIIPVYNNEGVLQKTFKIIYEKVILHNQDKSCELIFINDGSYDNSLNILFKLKKKYPKLIKIIKFTRNFGQVSAIIAGYHFATGKCLVNISSDLQDPPELINSMLNYHFSEQYEIVICKRDSRDESFFRRITSRIFYKIIKKLSFPNIPIGGFDFLLISNRIKEIVLVNNEANPFFQGQILWTGFNIKFIPYQRRKREIGKSGWTFGKKLKYLIDGVLSYSYFPLRLISFSGIVIAFLGFIYACIIFFAWIFGKVPIKGWTPMIIIILILSGIQILMLGIIGEYLWRTLDQVRNRQPYIIEKIYD